MAGRTTTASGAPRGMTMDELLALPATVNVTTASRALGIGHNAGYQLLRNGEFPVRTLRLGSVTRIPTAALWEALGVVPRTT